MGSRNRKACFVRSLHLDSGQLKGKGKVFVIGCFVGRVRKKRVTLVTLITRRQKKAAIMGQNGIAHRHDGTTQPVTNLSQPVIKPEDISVFWERYA